MNKGKILAIDYGTAKVGLAVSDEARLMAFGRGVVDRKKGFQNLIKVLQAICEQEKIVDFIIGLPFREDEQENEATTRIRNFSKKVGLYFPDIAIHFVDESFSSYEAQSLLKTSTKSPLHHHDDEFAAVIILQRYLDSIPG